LTAAELQSLNGPQKQLEQGQDFLVLRLPRPKFSGGGNFEVLSKVPPMRRSVSNAQVQAELSFGVVMESLVMMGRVGRLVPSSRVA
jgi:hypothetical protein